MIKLTNIIDRRLNPRDKNINNRQKFIQRSKQQIKEKVKEQIDKGNIADIENGNIKVRVKGTKEPNFNFDPSSGNKKYVLPGNDKYSVGDKEEKQGGGSGGGGSQAGTGESEDDFEFILNPDEYLDFIFQDLELPDLVKKQIKDVTELKPKREGFTNTGNPNRLDIVRSLKNSIGRRIGLVRPKTEELEELEKLLAIAIQNNDEEEVQRLELLIKEIKTRMTIIPWLDPQDLRYRNFNMIPQPMTQAVMVCIMDVSGSMGETEKNLAKRFFFLLHMFLNRKYKKVDIVFIKHHESAKEVDEHDFFYSRESGGTIVSSALELANKTITSRYNVNDWNIYVAQVSDGDNSSSDYIKTQEEMAKLLKLCQYFAYVEVKSNAYYTYSSRVSDLSRCYEEIAQDNTKLNMKVVTEVSDIWKVFRELFSKEK